MSRGNVSPRPEPAGSEGVLELNVGGTLFSTTAGRLVEAGELRRTVMQRTAVDKQGRPFIDRDPDSFRWVLSWLRDSDAPLPEDPLSVKRLLSEARYFKLPRLVKRCEALLKTNTSSAPRIVELKEYEAHDNLGVPEVLCIPIASPLLEPLYLNFEDIPVTEGLGRENPRIFAVKHAESVPQVASVLHQHAGYRVIGYSQGAVLMERRDDLVV